MSGSQTWEKLSYLRQHADSLLRAAQPSATELRRRIHRDPRTSGNERDTAKLLIEALNLEVAEWVSDGFMARLGSPGGAAIALRAELDGLPITETSGVEWAATNGVAHLCGHDVHLAALGAVVEVVRSAQVPVPLITVWQHREESVPSGAPDFLGSRWLQRQDIRAFFGTHLQPQLPAGTVAAVPGAVNASADEFRVTITGAAAHGAYPHLGRDPILAAAAVVLALQHLVSRRTDPMEPAVLTVGEIRGGSAGNAIPDHAAIRGTIRAFSESSRTLIAKLVAECANGIAAGYGCEAQTTWGLGPPVLHNDEVLTPVVSAALAEAGFLRNEALRSCGGDDFAFYGTKFPAVMIFVGVGDGSPSAPGLHHPQFLPAHSAIFDVAKVLLTCYLTAAEQLLSEFPDA